MEDALVEDIDAKSKAASKSRKRAPKACLSCRARKVRCDVSQRGRPCMNCYLDSETCVVTSRASRLRRPQELHDHDDVEITDAPSNVESQCPPPNRSSEEVVRSRATGQPFHDAGDSQAASPTNEADAQSRDTDDILPAPQPPLVGNSAGTSTGSQPRTQPAEATLELHFSESSLSPVKHCSGEHNINFSSEITYTYYSFLGIGNLPNLLPQDVNYLDSQGCLRLPTRAILDEMVQQYFLHVHPYLPLFNEGDFWEMYSHHGPGEPPQKMSLLVFQALLFASCNFLSRNSVKALGFPTIRATRAAFYRRTKFLYDFETETSPLATAQAALLLSFWSSAYPSSGTKRPNSSWLGTAIEQARSAEAHQYYSLSANGPGSHSVRVLKRQNMLKRLWWCCIIRDRVLALSCRRSIQITRMHFDFDAHTPLGFDDLADEIDRSKVYNPGTKRCLLEILALNVQFDVTLTDILMLVFPLDDVRGWGRQGSEEGARKVKQCRLDLLRWYNNATQRFPMFGGGGSSSRANAPGTGEDGKEYQHDSVILFTNLMYMYYHSSRVVLCHHEVLASAMAAGTSSPESTATDASTIYENRHEIQDAASGVTECLKELIQRRLARWLPISAVTCIALPIVLHIIDIKLSPKSAPASSFDSNADSALKQHRLNILIEAMKNMQPQYDGVDWVSDAIRHIVNLAQLDEASANNTSTTAGPVSASHGSGPGAISDWTDILSSHPTCYLRLAMTMDLSLSKNRFPEERDFPANLRGLFTGGLSPIKVLLNRGKAPVSSASAITSIPRAPSMLPSPQHLRDWAANDQAIAFGMQMGFATDLGLHDLRQPDSGADPSSMAGAVDGGGGGMALPIGLTHGINVTEMTEQAFAEAMGILEGNVLNAYGFRTDQQMSGGARSASDVSYEDVDREGRDDGGGGSAWMGMGWDGLGGVGGMRSDQDTAMALLEAMESGNARFTG